MLSRIDFTAFGRGSMTNIAFELTRLPANAAKRQKTFNHLNQQTAIKQMATSRKQIHSHFARLLL